MMNWAWAATVGDCLRWTADADEALGKVADARLAWQRLLSLRALAAPPDPLASAARAALARLPQQ